jgi:hypothetical protein
MKIAVECQSKLLQKSLELFLSKYLTSIKHCDIVVRDGECIDNIKCFWIGSESNADLIKPFSKSQLILALENRYAIIQAKEIDIEDDEIIPIDENSSKDFSILERRIVMLTQEYQANILNVVKAFYED